MYPYQKQNLIAYRKLLPLTAWGCLASIIVGMLIGRPTGLLFAVSVLICAVAGPGLLFFRWNSEPTARRQFATGFIALVMIAVGGAVVVDTVLGLVDRHLFDFDKQPR